MREMSGDQLLIYAAMPLGFVEPSGPVVGRWQHRMFKDVTRQKEQQPPRQAASCANARSSALKASMFVGLL